MEEQKYKVRSPFLPLYSTVRQVLKILEGVPKTVFMEMESAIWDQRGTPQNPVDWSAPDTWIKERLSGKFADLAHDIWERSEKQVNPRYVSGTDLLINTYELLVPDDSGVYRLTDRGEGFLKNDPKVIKEIDETEGIPQLLSILSMKTKAKRSDLISDWGDFLREYSNYGTASTISDTLRSHLLNLVERRLTARSGNFYEITPVGLEYLASFRGITNDPRKKVLEVLTGYNNEQIAYLRQKLSEMHPTAFEHLVKDLLEAMGYEDVNVTKVSGDKGIDVVATLQFGITTITEFVQVKRIQGSIPRPILDQLRGALPYHKALRGTLITIGSFSKGCQEAAQFPGAAPITLIDGEKLLEYLIDNQIAIKKKPADLFEIDEDYFRVSDGKETVGEG